MSIQNHTYNDVHIDTIDYRSDGSLRSDEYRLSIRDGKIRIHASDHEGEWYAIQTLKQIFQQSEVLGNGSFLVPELEIVDYPDFPVRGVMLDVSRDKVYTLETLFHIIDVCSLLKFNQLQLYIEHTFAYSGHEKVWQNASPYTVDNIHQIVAYAADRGIVVVPNQNSVGHMERWLKHPEYQHLAECPNGFEDPWGEFRSEPSTLSPVIPETLDFLDELYGQLLPLFPGEGFNVGGDEPWELGKGKSRRKADDIGIPGLYLEYLKSIHGIVSKRRRVMHIWADIVLQYPELLDELPKDIVLMQWGYEAEHPFDTQCPVLKKSGMKYQVVSGTSSWLSLGGRWQNMVKNNFEAALHGQKNGASGFYVSDWGDVGHMQQFPIMFPGLCVGAAVAWRTESHSQELERIVKDWMSVHVFGDSSGKLAEALYLLGNLPVVEEHKLHNVNILAVLLLDPGYQYYRKEYPYYRGRSFKQERKMLEQALELVGTVEHSQFAKELSFTCRLLLHSIDLAESFFQTKDFKIEQIPVDNRRQLAVSLESLLPEYKELWLHRNREGGLIDSLRHFEMLSELYRSIET